MVQPPRTPTAAETPQPETPQPEIEGTESPAPVAAGPSPNREADPGGAAAVIGRPRGPATGDRLSALERRVLAFEKRPWNPRDPGPKERAIREEFDLSPTRYGQILHALLDNPAAMAREPVLVNRLRRLREKRAAARAGRTG